DAQGLYVDEQGNLYITGTFSNTVDFDPGAGIDSLVAVKANDLYVAKYTTDGAYEWAVGMGGNNAETGYEIVADDNGNIYVTGYYSGTVDFDPSPATFPLTSNLMSYDAFILKLNQGCQKFVTVTEKACDSLNYNGATYKIS